MDNTKTIEKPYEQVQLRSLTRNIGKENSTKQKISFSDNRPIAQRQRDMIKTISFQNIQMRRMVDIEKSKGPEADQQLLIECNKKIAKCEGKIKPPFNIDEEANRRLEREIETIIRPVRAAYDEAMRRTEEDINHLATEKTRILGFEKVTGQQYTLQAESTLNVEQRDAIKIFCDEHFEDIRKKCYHEHGFEIKEGYLQKFCPRNMFQIHQGYPHPKYSGREYTYRDEFPSRMYNDAIYKLFNGYVEAGHQERHRIVIGKIMYSIKRDIERENKDITDTNHKKTRKIMQL